MSDIQQLNSHERIAHWLDRPGAASGLSSYFRDADPTQGYTGRYFELVGGGGDQPEHANVVTADDLIAVEMLSVTIPPRVAADLLLGSKGSELNALLAQIPAAVSLTDEDAGPHIAEGSATWQAWDLLIAGHKTGMGTAKVSKLLARKRGSFRCTTGSSNALSESPPIGGNACTRFSSMLAEMSARRLRNSGSRAVSRRT